MIITGKVAYRFICQLNRVDAFKSSTLDLFLEPSLLCSMYRTTITNMLFRTSLFRCGGVPALVSCDMTRNEGMTHAILIGSLLAYANDICHIDEVEYSQCIKAQQHCHYGLRICHSRHGSGSPHVLITYGTCTRELIV